MGRSEGLGRLDLDVTPVMQQRSRGPLGVARGPKLAAFQTVEHTIRGKEAVSKLVSGDNTCGSALDFDDIGLGHVCTLAGWSGAPVWFCDEILGQDQRQTPVAAEKQRRVTHLRAIPISGGWFDRMRLISEQRFTALVISNVLRGESMKWKIKFDTATSRRF
jgi:hypothetical protein